MSAVCLRPVGIGVASCLRILKRSAGRVQTLENRDKQTAAKLTESL